MATGARRLHLRRGPVLGALVVAFVAPRLAAAPAPFDPSRVAWTELRFTASKLFLKAHSEVHLDELPGAEARRALFPPAEGEGLEPPPEGTLLVTVHSRFLGKETTDRVWLGAGDGTTFQQYALRHGKKGYWKRFRYTAGGVDRLRVSPATAAEGELPPESWSKVERSFVTYGEAAAGCAVVAPPAVLFYAVSAAALTAPGDRLALCVYSKDRVIPVTVEVEGAEAIDVDYTADGERHRGEVAALHLAVRPQETGAEEGSKLELLGLEGPVEIFLDPERRIPLLLRGRIPPAGRVNVALEAVELRHPQSDVERRTEGGAR